MAPGGPSLSYVDKKGGIETIPYEESTPKPAFPTDEELDLELEDELEADEEAVSGDSDEDDEEIEDESEDDEDLDEDSDDEDSEEDEEDLVQEVQSPGRPVPAKLERLHKILAAAGIASRRHAEELITEGRVQVNGQTVTTLGFKADPTRDHIRVDGKLLQGAEKLRYFILNKPKGFVTTVSDPEGRPTVMQFFSKLGERLYPVGRLDYQSEGLLLVTNDGPLANKLTRADSGVEKTYLVKVSGNPSEEALARLRTGVLIPKGKPKEGSVKTAPARIRLVRAGENPWFEIVLIEGRNRELRKMFAGEGHNVEKIRRVSYGPLVLDIEQAQIRELDPSELDKLRLAAEGKFKPRKIDFSVLLPKEAGRTVDHDAAKERGKRPYNKNFRFSERRGPGTDRGGFSARGKSEAERGNFGKPKPRGESGFERPAREGGPERPRREGSFGRPDRSGFSKGAPPFRKDGPGFGKSRPGFGNREDRPRPERSGGFSSRPRREDGDAPRGESRGPRREFGGDRAGGEKRSFGPPRGDRPFRPRGEGRPEGRSFEGGRGPRREGEERSFGAPRGDRPFRPRTERGPERGPGRPFSDRPRGERPEGRPEKPFGSFKPRPRRDDGDAPRGESRGPRREFGGDRAGGEKRSFAPRGDRPFRPRSEGRAEGDRPRREGGERGFGGKPKFGGKPGFKPGGKPGGRPKFGGKSNGRPGGFKGKPGGRGPR